MKMSTCILLLMTLMSGSSLAQMIQPTRTKPNYPKARIWPAVELEIGDEHEIIQLYCRTKQLTNVRLPLEPEETIQEIMIGDDQRIWSIHGHQSRWFTTKPSNLAFQTTAAIRTSRGKMFHFRLFNLSFDADLFEFETEEEQDAFLRLRTSYAGHDPYHNVVVRFREDSLAVSEAKRLAALEARLQEALAKADARVRAFEAEKRQMTETFNRRLTRKTREYAALVQADFKVRYKKRRYKKRFPVEKVFTDGAFTWIQVHPSLEQFHLYEVKEDGSFEVVNFTNENNLYRIDRVCERLEFRNKAKGDWLFRVER